MSIYTVHGGHAAQGNAYSGASGLCHESVEDRKIKDAVIKYLRLAGHTVHDCTVDSGSSQSNIITQIKQKINSHKGVSANISIHLNSYNGNAKGTECEVYSNSGSTGQTASRICSGIAALGFTNRGVKTRTDLGVLKGITNGGINILVETFFCDNESDYSIYNKVGADGIGKAIAEAIVNGKINTNKTQEDKDMDRADIQLYEPNGTDAQKWQPILNKDGSYSFKNKACGLMLDIPGASTRILTKMQAYKSNGTNAQKFRLVQSKGYFPAGISAPYIIQSVLGDLCVDCDAGKTANGTKIQTCNINNSNAQKWVILDDGIGWWTFVNVNSGKVIDVVGGGR